MCGKNASKSLFVNHDDMVEGGDGGGGDDGDDGGDGVMTGGAGVAGAGP